MGTRSSSPFDVFFSYNTQDKLVVRRIGHALQARGIRVWLDEWALVPGRPWQDDIEEIIQNVRAAAVMIGPGGLGRWERPEMRACISQFVTRALPVIPVLLPGSEAASDLPAFLSQFTCVAFRDIDDIAALDRLAWGITGVQPEAILGGHVEDDALLSRNVAPLSRMRYFTYISAAKVDMLYAQLPAARRALLPYNDQNNDIARLDHVLDSLRQNGQIGDFLSETAPFIAGRFTVRCALYGWRGGELVMWIGEWLDGDTHVRVALGGSAHHLSGNTKPSAAVNSSSATPAIEAALNYALGVTARDGVRFGHGGRDTFAELRDNATETRQPFARPCTGDENYFTRGLALAAERLEAAATPAQEIDTVFRVLARWRSAHVKEVKPGHGFSEQEWYCLHPDADKMDLILGTPLYIALN